MGLLEALRLRPREIKQSQSMAVALLLYMGQEVIWMTKDLEAYAKEGYMACQDAYACIEAIAKAIESLPIILFRGEGDKQTEVKDHPLLTLMRRPNPRQGQTKFIGSFARFLMITGNSYAEAAGPTTGPPKELYVLKPHRVSILKGDAVQPIKGYRYRAAGGKADFDVDDVLHMATFHPTDDWYGLAPIEVAARGIDISNLGMKWNAKLLTNDMRPSGGFIFEKPLLGQARELFKKDIRETAQGADNAGNFLILDNVKDFKQLSISPKEGDYSNLDKLTTRKICRVFGVAPEIIGDAENKTYSNYQEARLALYIDTAIPLALWILDEFNTWLSPKFSAPGISTQKLRLAVDIDNVDALQEKRDKAWTRMGGAWMLKFNEKRVAIGYAPIKEPIGEMYHLPIGLVETDGSVSSEGDEGGDEGGDQGVLKIRLKTHKQAGFWGDVKRRKQLWLAFEARVKAREKSYDKIAEAYLKRQASEIRAKILAASSLSELSATALLDVAAETKLYEKKFWPWYVDHFIRAGEAGMRASKGEILDEAEMTALPGSDEHKDEPQKPTSWTFQMTEEQRAKLRDMVLNSGTKVNQTTVKSILEKLLAANEANLTVNKLGQDLYDMVSDFSRWKAQLWSRTESAKIDNYGELEGYKETEFVEEKGWGCSFLPTSRDTHIAADGQVRDLDEDYEVGGKLMMFPGDPKGGPENCCNCFPASTLIDVPAPIFAGMLRWHRGKMIEIITRNGKHLSGTPNHPILTDRGWIPFRLLTKGQNVISCSRRQEMSFAYPNINDDPCTISEIFNSMSKLGNRKRIYGTNLDFHGDGMNSDIDIVTSDRFLKNGMEPTFLEHLSESHFTRANFNQGFLPGNGSLAKFLFGNRLRSAGNIGGESDPLSGFWAEMANANPDGIAQRSDYNAAFIEEPINDRADDPVFLSQLFERNLSGFITPDEIIFVREYDFDGHVYNLQNEVGWYIANNIISHNCNCFQYPIVRTP